MLCGNPKSHQEAIGVLCRLAYGLFNGSSFSSAQENGLSGKSLKIESKKVHKSKINPLKSCDFSGFLVAAAGLEPATSGL